MRSVLTPELLIPEDRLIVGKTLISVLIQCIPISIFIFSYYSDGRNTTKSKGHLLQFTLTSLKHLLFV